MKIIFALVFLINCVWLNGVAIAKNTRATFCQLKFYDGGGKFTLSDDKKSVTALANNAYVQTCGDYKWNSNKKICMRFQNNPNNDAYIGIVSSNAAWFVDRVEKKNGGQDCWYGDNEFYCGAAGKKFQYNNQPSIFGGDEVCVRFRKGRLSIVRNNVRLGEEIPLKKKTKFFVLGYGDLGQKITLLD